MSYLLVKSSSLFLPCKGIYLDSGLYNKMHLGALVLKKKSNQPPNQPTNQPKKNPKIHKKPKTNKEKKPPKKVDVGKTSKSNITWKFQIHVL